MFTVQSFGNSASAVFGSGQAGFQPLVPNGGTASVVEHLATPVSSVTGGNSGVWMRSQSDPLRKNLNFIANSAAPWQSRKEKKGERRSSERKMDSPRIGTNDLVVRVDVMALQPISDLGSYFNFEIGPVVYCFSQQNLHIGLRATAPSSNFLFNIRVSSIAERHQHQIFGITHGCIWFAIGHPLV